MLGACRVLSRVHGGVLLRPGHPPGSYWSYPERDSPGDSSGGGGRAASWPHLPAPRQPNGSARRGLHLFVWHHFRVGLPGVPASSSWAPFAAHFPTTPSPAASPQAPITAPFTFPPSPTSSASPSSTSSTHSENNITTTAAIQCKLLVTTAALAGIASFTCLDPPRCICPHPRPSCSSISGSSIRLDQGRRHAFRISRHHHSTCRRHTLRRIVLGRQQQQRRRRRRQHRLRNRRNSCSGCRPRRSGPYGGRGPHVLAAPQEAGSGCRGADGPGIRGRCCRRRPRVQNSGRGQPDGSRRGRASW